MASEKITAIVESVKTMTVLELKELVDTICEEFGVSAVVIDIDSSRTARFAHGIRECGYACGIHGLGINALRRNARKHRILQYDRNRLTRCTDSRLCGQSKS